MRGKLEDGQLSHAPVTLSDIDKICEAFSAVLNGVFHERIEYPVMTAEQLRAQYAGTRALPPSEESPVEAMELVRVPEIDPREAENVAEEAVNSATDDHTRSKVSGSESARTPEPPHVPEVIREPETAHDPDVAREPETEYVQRRRNPEPGGNTET